MYTQFFGLTKAPFSLTPDQEFLYLSEQHKNALNSLKYGILQPSGFTVLTGEIGCGKSTLLRNLINDIDSTCEVGVITNTHASFGNLLEWVLSAFNLKNETDNEVERYQLFRGFIAKQKLKNRRAVLVIDEAQNMAISLLEELRLLSNLNDGQETTLQIILCGQTELLEKLNDTGLTQFAQRIAIEYHLKPLNHEETARYIAHRLKVAGAQSAIFSPQALLAIFQHSGGIPRIINNIADMALVFAFANDSKVEYETVMEVINQRKTGGIKRPRSLTESNDESISKNRDPLLTSHALVKRPKTELVSLSLITSFAGVQSISRIAANADS